MVSRHAYATLPVVTRKLLSIKDTTKIRTRMWANAQRDGRPAEYR